MPDDRHRLLFGPYRPPALQRGDRTDCLVRGLVRITGWNDARIPRPKCIPVGGRSQPTLLVDEELARAVGHESAAAIMFWWGQREADLEVAAGAGRRPHGLGGQP